MSLNFIASWQFFALDFPNFMVNKALISYVSGSDLHIKSLNAVFT